MTTDTICALATAPGGALGIIRISGPQALEILSHVFMGAGDVQTYAANTIHYGHIVEYDAMSQHQLPIDEVMVSIFLAPHSYTGEDSVEISCHGSRYILNKVLALLIANGCRQAGPGEFTQRAYLNGKMDLSQAEAVADLIASSNKATHQMAMSQLRGRFSSELSQLREQLLKLTSLLELELDFSDHEDLEFADRSELLELTKTIDKHITILAHSFETGQALKQGIPVAIVGKTNVGKSTLLNALLKDDRAIVSDIHGTTRDTIEDTIDIQGVTFRFIDTAGIRQTTDEVEQIGITRTYAAIDKARIVLWLIDVQPDTEEIKEMQERSNDKSLIIIVNKIDKLSEKSTADLFSQLSSLTIPEQSSPTHSPSYLLSISAKYGQGLDSLEKAIYQAANIPALQESDVIVSNARHYDALVRAHKSLNRVLEGMNQQISGDLLSEDLRLTLDTLSEITGGQITPNEVLGNIFKNFCVGK
jgi:tRNA modification GTPase